MGVDVTPFIKEAQKLQDETGIPTSITLAQIMLESSGNFKNGMSSLAYNGKNLFGVKGVGDSGSLLLPTTEVMNGIPKVIQATFKKYSSYYQSMVDHAKVLSLPRYEKYLSSAKTVNEYAQGIQKGGYATDPEYANKLLKIIETNNLNKYDTGNMKFTPLNESGGNSSESIEENEGEGQTGIISTVFNQVIKDLLLIVLFILMVVFFLKAFPVVEDVGTTVVPQARAVKKVTKLIK